MSEKIFKEAIEAIIKGDSDKATDIAKRGLDAGLDPLELMDQGFIPGINQVGDLFETGRLFLPQLVYSATAMEKATAIINAALPEEKASITAKIVIASDARYTPVRHFDRNRKRTAEISVPACPIPIQNTKVVMYTPQNTGGW